VHTARGDRRAGANQKRITTASEGHSKPRENDEFARKRQQLEQLKTDLENKLDASRVEWTRAIREGHSSNQEYTAFINNYEAQCSRLRELFGEKWELERELRSIQQF
jgi:hypothetical protein